MNNGHINRNDNSNDCTGSSFLFAPSDSCYSIFMFVISDCLID